MKSFKIKSSLALGLSHRLRSMDGQTVVDACKENYNAVKAIRKNIAIANALDKANMEFVKAVGETEEKKRAIFAEIKAQYDKDTEGKTQEEAGVMARELNVKYNEKAAEVQKESKANPETIVTVEIADEEYEKVLMPVFMKTVQLWDVNGDGKGQELFLEVASALEDVTA